MSFFTKARGILNRPINSFFKPKTVAPVQFTIPDPVLPARTKPRTGKRWKISIGNKVYIVSRRLPGVRKYPVNGARP